MAVIYEPTGKAKEYSDLACNIYSGCGHGCVYCYAPACVRKTKENFFSNPSPRKNIIQQIKKESAKVVDDEIKKNVLLCFTCDPYQPIDDEYRLSRSAIMSFNEHKIPVTILTKGGMSAVKDFDLLSENTLSEYAVTLTTDIESESLEWEPGAANPDSRIESLKYAKAAGLRTWVSFEPVFNPDAVYRLIDKTSEYVDLYKVGKMNYHPVSKKIDWGMFKSTVQKKLVRNNKAFYIKQDLRKY